MFVYSNLNTPFIHLMIHFRTNDFETKYSFLITSKMRRRFWFEHWLVFWNERHNIVSLKRMNFDPIISFSYQWAFTVGILNRFSMSLHKLIPNSCFIQLNDSFTQRNIFSSRNLFIFVVKSFLNPFFKYNIYWIYSIKHTLLCLTWMDWILYSQFSVMTIEHVYVYCICTKKKTRKSYFNRGKGKSFFFCAFIKYAFWWYQFIIHLQKLIQLMARKH